MRTVRHPHVTRSTAPRRPRAVVIGGGLAGLATAGLLARDGYQVELCEALDRVGGRVDVLRQDGFSFDIGPTWYLMDEVMAHFFSLMGTDVNDHLDLIPLDPAYRLYAESGSCVNVSSGIDAVSKLFESREPGAGQAIAKHLASAENAYQVALENFLYTNFDSLAPWCHKGLITRLPELASLLTTSLEAHANKVVRDPVLRQMLTFHAVFLSAAPNILPSLYHLMAHLDLGVGVSYPRGGMRSLVDAIERVVRSAGVTIHTSAPAVAIRTRPGGRGRTQATVTGVDVRFGDEIKTLAADVVVSAADLWACEQMLPEPLQTYPQRYWERSRNGIGTVLGMVGVTGDVPLAHHSFFFTHDWQRNFDQIFGPHPQIPDPASIYVCRASATDTVAPPGAESLFFLIPVPADDTIGHGSIDMGSSAALARGDRLVEETLDRAIEQVARWADIPDLAQRIVLRRSLGPADHSDRYNSYHGNALGPAHVLKQSAFLRARSASAHVDGLVYAGQTTAPGIGVPMTLISAENVVKRLRGDTTATPLVEPHDSPRLSALQPIALAGQQRAARQRNIAQTIGSPLHRLNALVRRR